MPSDKSIVLALACFTVTGGNCRREARTMQPLWTRGLEGACLRGRLDFEPGPLEKQREKIPSGSEVKVN